MRDLVEYDAPDNPLDVVVFAAPQLSLFELQALAGLLEGRSVHPQVSLIVAIARCSGVMSSIAIPGVVFSTVAPSPVVSCDDPDALVNIASSSIAKTR